MLAYTYVADFSDGTKFEQPADDSSKLQPGRASSKFDFLAHSEGRTLSRLTFRGKSHTAWLEPASGKFCIDGIVVEKGDDLSSFGGSANWVELRPGEAAHGYYFRRVARDAHSGAILEMTFCFGRPGDSVFLALS